MQNMTPFILARAVSRDELTTFLGLKKEKRKKIGRKKSSEDGG